MINDKTSLLGSILVQGPQGNNNSGNGGGNNNNRRRRYHKHNRGNRPQGPNNNAPRPNSAEGRNQGHQSSSRNRSRGGRVLTTNQVLVKYDNLLDQHLITRKKYYEYFNRVDDRQLAKLEKNFFDSIEHLRRFESNLEPWQREALEKRKTERYKLDLTYSQNRDFDPAIEAKVEISDEEIEDPHFKESQKEAFDAYKDDTEESEGTYEDYLRMKGL